MPFCYDFNVFFSLSCASEQTHTIIFILQNKKIHFPRADLAIQRLPYDETSIVFIRHASMITLHSIVVIF